MSKSKTIDYQEILDNLQNHLIELKKRRSVVGFDTFINFQIEYIEKQISAIRKEIFFQKHPNLQK